MESHSDFTTEGYIGVTSKEPEERFKQHLAASKTEQIILSKALRKHGDEVIVTTLLKGSDEYCYLMEEKLRPSERIGWNTVKGGGKPPIKNTPHTEEAKRKISEASKIGNKSEASLAARAMQVGSKRTKASKKLMSEKAQGRLPWETSRCNKAVWLQADKFFEVFSETGMKSKSMEKLLGIKISTLSNLYKKFVKENWNPKADPLWTDWVCSQYINKGSK